MQITKASGEREPFHKNKFCDSLKQAGAPEDMTNEVCEQVSSEIEPDMTTSDIFRKASQYLTQKNARVAARYNLKHGISELGPAGFIFEQFVEIVLQTLGYETKRNQIVQGKCVTHEIDVLAKKDNVHYLIEAKYHNKKGIKTPLDVVMYGHARLLDIQEEKAKTESEPHEHRMWLVTNTKFTTKAIAYAKCRNIPLTGWNYPENEGLEDIITRYALYPITSLPSVNAFEREQFAKSGTMLARDLAPYTAKDLTEKFNISPKVAEQIIEEMTALVYGEGVKGEQQTAVAS
ncbi:MAG TPA: ATP cone domain-containing protein [Candidatus Paceibacterota bacterium]|nr:ATP cone domain-containing protein [Candidatus Paceibacterota bacterium]